MHSSRTEQALIDVRDNAKLAQEFVAGLSFDDFMADRRTFYAMTRAIEIISEAAPRLPPELRARHPDLPWRAIAGVGNVYRHDYDSVAEDLVWRTLHESLPPLQAAVTREIETTFIVVCGDRLTPVMRSGARGDDKIRRGLRRRRPAALTG